MLKFNNIRIRVGVAFLVFAFPCLRLLAQDVLHLEGEDLSFKDRIAIRTNVVDWVLTTPNIAFDYDIVSTAYDKRSVGVGLKYNWNTSHTYLPKQVYNLFDVRFDYRFYWRQQPYDNRENYYGDWEREWINSSKGLGKLRARANCFRAVENPKSHLSLFVGPYLSASTFSIKLTERGRQGFAVGAGLTGGVALPLYGYENGSAIDLEFGGSVGLQFSSFDLYRLNVNDNEYTKEYRDYSFLPLVTDIRVSLVYRFRSISKQHTEIDYALIDRRYVTRLMELDWESASAYNDSIGVLKDELDSRNKEIALYKQTVESEPGFNKAYSLEYLTPYMYMMEAPKKYTRHNKDTLPKVHIDSIEQIVDPILLSVREGIDSIPHVTSAQIDKEFVNQYNNISDADGKVVNRTALIREIYTRLNSYIEDNNSKLVASTFGAEVYSEKLNKYNVKQQGRSLVEITYKDSVRTVEMTDNDKVEWLNSIKRKAWADVQKRTRGEYPGRVDQPEVYDFLAADTVKADSIVADSVKADSMMIDSLMTDSMRLDSLLVGVALNDSIVSDSVLTDSLLHMTRANGVEGQAKKSAGGVSKNKSKVKTEKTKKAKTKKSKKNAVAVARSVEVMDSVADVVADSVVVLATTLADSVAEKVISDTTLLDVRPEKVVKVKKSKKADKVKAAKKAGKAKKTKKAANENVNVSDSIMKVGEVMPDSIPAESIAVPDAAPADSEEAVSVGELEKLALLNKDYFIKEDDED